MECPVIRVSGRFPKRRTVSVVLLFRLIVHSTMNSVRETRFAAILLFCGSEVGRRYVFRSWYGERAFL